MKLKKGILSIVILVLLSSGSLSAQRYNTAVGLRVGNSAGVTVQQRVSNRYTIEGILQTDITTYTDFIALGQYHGRIIYQKRLNWYLGGGLHVGSLSDYGTTFGPAIMGGVEMTVDRFNFSIDYLMMNHLGEVNDNFKHYAGISLRYIIVKRPKKRIVPKINLRFWKWGKKDK